MKQSDVEPPKVAPEAGYPVLYNIYLLVMSWVLRRLVAAISGDGTAFDMVVEIPTPGHGEGKLRVSVCVPSSTSRPTSRPLPCILVLEGGGFILGEPNDGQDLARQLCNRLDVVVLSLDYAKSPRHPYPHALFQAHDVLLWLISGEASKAVGVEIDCSRVATLGKSAGGNLALALSLLIAFESGPCSDFRQQLGPVFKHVAQILLYPSTACDRAYRDRFQLADPAVQRKSLPVWVGELMESCYLPPGIKKNSIFVAPILTEESLLRDLKARMPRSSFFLAGSDCLNNEAKVCASKLSKAGVETDVYEYPDAVHGYIQYKVGAKEYREEDILDTREKICDVLASAFQVA